MSLTPFSPADISWSGVISKECGGGGVACRGAALRGAFIDILAYTIRLNLSGDNVPLLSFEPWLETTPENGLRA